MAGNHLLTLIRSAVTHCLKTDRPAGFVLSGGLDSSTVVRVAQTLGHDLPTFTGFYPGHPECDERKYARLVAGSEHHEIPITPQDFIDNFDAMVPYLREPLQGIGTFGQYMVAKHVASQGIKVVLSGEGSDELFGGYARQAIVAGETPPDGYENYVLPDGYPRDLEGALRHDYDRLGDLLAVDDQMCAAHGLEARAPFTDPAIVEYALGLPVYARVQKRFLRAAVRGVVPDEIIDRRDKMGFPAPLVEWAQGPLRDFIGDRLGYTPDPSRPFDRGWFHELCRLAPEYARAA